MSLKDIIAKVTALAAKVDASLREEVNAIKAQVDGALTDALAQVKDLTEKVEGLETSKTELEGQISTLTNNLSEKNKELMAFNDWLTDACLNGKLLDLKGSDGKPLAADASPEDVRKAALSVPLAEKQKAYAGALNAAFAKAGLPNATLPKAPEAPIGSAEQQGTMKRAEFAKLTPAAQLNFVNKGGKLTD